MCEEKKKKTPLQFSPWFPVHIAENVDWLTPHSTNRTSQSNRTEMSPFQPSHPFAQLLCVVCLCVVLFVVAFFVCFFPPLLFVCFFFLCVRFLVLKKNFQLLFAFFFFDGFHLSKQKQKCKLKGVAAFFWVRTTQKKKQMAKKKRTQLTQKKKTRRFFFWTAIPNPHQQGKKWYND